MYTVEKYNDLLKVTETTITFTSTIRRSTLIDTTSWIKSNSYNPDVVNDSDVNLTIKMVPADIAWTQHNYIPKLDVV